MDETVFWETVEKSRKGLSRDDNERNMALQVENLKRILLELSEQELLDYANISASLFNKAYRWDLWGAAYVIGGGCSDDSFMDFRSWLISMGREAYETALASPDEIGQYALDPRVADCFFEEFDYVADQVYEEKFGKAIELDMDAGAEPVGQQWNEDDLPDIYPKLSAQFAD